MSTLDIDMSDQLVRLTTTPKQRICSSRRQTVGMKPPGPLAATESFPRPRDFPHRFTRLSTTYFVTVSETGVPASFDCNRNWALCVYWQVAQARALARSLGFVSILGPTSDELSYVCGKWDWSSTWTGWTYKCLATKSASSLNDGMSDSHQWMKLALFG